MTLYLVRHSKAEPSAPGGDAHRSLTEKGRKRIAEVAGRVKLQDWKPGLRIVSPYLRARQTSEGLARILDFSGYREEESSLVTPDSDPREALVELQAWEKEGHQVLWVITHNPFVTDLTRLLINPAYNWGITYHTPSIFALEFSQGLTPRGGEVVWEVHPEEFD